MKEAMSRTLGADTSKWFCVPCNKTAYHYEGRGWTAIRNILRLPNRTEIIPCRVYPCPHDNGYHLTHHRERSFL